MIDFAEPIRTALGGAVYRSTDGAYSVHESGDYGPKRYVAWWHRFPIRDRGQQMYSDRKLSEHRMFNRAVESCERHARREARNPTTAKRTRKRTRR